MKELKKYIIAIFLLCFATNIFAQDLSLPALSITSNDGSTESVSVSLQVLAVMTALTLLPALILTMTSFTRIIIVLAILRQAIGMAQTPSNQILIGLALFLSLFIMAPTFYKINELAVEPYINEKIDYNEALNNAKGPIVDFMLMQTRKTDLQLFEQLGKQENIIEEKNLPISIIISAFITSELKTAFQIGFLIFLPFLIIDLVVASVLMSMGMMMLSPLIISLPFKVMLFVLIDGWTLITATLANSFG